MTFGVTRNDNTVERPVAGGDIQHMIASGRDHVRSTIIIIQ